MWTILAEQGANPIERTRVSDRIDDEFPSFSDRLQLITAVMLRPSFGIAVIRQFTMVQVKGRCGDLADATDLKSVGL
jgi:hypothetical protein